MEPGTNIRRLDLKGEVCPYTFVKSKLAIEEMAPGELLEITVDYFPASTNIPRSMANEGHEVIETSKVNSTEWRIVVRKGQDDAGA